ncbi:transposase [Cupriavidus pinatubonensis]|uniref:transposase n=1 Tax=Cupriavidus pinatubonensis TaxID=248026 RepID=UPI001FD5A900|nr:transposase [Cupriavidus pinatubonensis]
MNRLRGLLAEFGVFLPQGIDQLHAHFVEHIQDGTNELSGTAREALMHAWAQWQALNQEIAWFDRQIATHARQDPNAKRCMDMCGVGPLTASATVVDARQFKNGRQMAAWLGTVPRQKSSGGKQRLGRITKQGNESCACCSSLVRVPHSIPRLGVTTGSRAGLSNCRPASATTRPWLQ